MNNQAFQELAQEKVIEYFKSKGVKVAKQEVFIVWLSKVLQNNKALLSTTLPDEHYFEVTFNGDKNELYVDVYDKEENLSFTV